MAALPKTRLPPLPTIRDIMKIYRLSAIKQLSQNFLMDYRITDKIVKCAKRINNAEVLEVGPGPGIITRSILRKFPKKLIVVEKDKRFKPTLEMLKDSYVNGEMDIIFDDIMNTNMTNLFSKDYKKDWDDYSPDIYLIGNLPFSVSTALIIKWLQDISERQGAWSYGRVKMVLTFQKEVAERLVAEPSQEQRCRLSVMAQAWTIPKLEFIIPGKVFVPEPDVDVGVVSFIPLKKPRTDHKFTFFEKVNRHLFSFRQKHNYRCAQTLFPPEYQDDLVREMYELADVDEKIRAFELTVEQVHKLASAYNYICEKHPEIVNYNYRASNRVLSTNFTKRVKLEDCEDYTI